MSSAEVGILRCKIRGEFWPQKVLGLLAYTSFNYSSSINDPVLFPILFYMPIQIFVLTEGATSKKVLKNRLSESLITADENCSRNYKLEIRSHEIRICPSNAEASGPHRQDEEYTI
jgi:hypothetical protein